MSDFQVVGVSPEVMADPRVQEALHGATDSGGVEAAKELLGADTAASLEQYGIKLRPLSLTVVGPMMVQMNGFKPSFPESFYMQAMIFLLGAPLKDVYAALIVGDKEGTPSFMAAVAEWIQASNIPMDLGKGVAESIQRSFETAQKVSPGDDGSKNVEGRPGS